MTGWMTMAFVAFFVMLVGRHRALRKASRIGICGDRIVCRHHLDRRGSILDVSFWATDPNYPHMLVPGRVLFIMHSLLLYGGNLWLLWQIRWR